MTGHRLHVPSPAEGLQTVVRLYPWSALWVLLAMGLALALNGSLVALGIALLLMLAVAGHSIYRHHHEPREDGGKDDGAAER